MDKLQLDKQSVIAAIPDFLELSFSEAMVKYDEAIATSKIKITSLSYSPSMHWSLGRHGLDKLGSGL